MKIVFLTPAAQRGGAEAVLLDLLGVLREAKPGWDLHVLSGEDGPLLAKIRALGIGCETLAFPSVVRSFGENRQAEASRTVPSGWQKLLSKATRLVRWSVAGCTALCYSRRLRARLGQLEPDIIHTNGMKMHLLGALAKPRMSSLIWHLHDYLGSRPAMKPLLRRLSSRCALIVANSHSVEDDIREVLRTGPPVKTVYNAVDLNVFKPDGPVLDLDKLAGLQPAAAGTVKIGLVATFALWKGHEVFLRAAQASTVNSRFYVIGGPVYATAGSQRTLEELRTLAQSLGIVGRVGFTGLVDDVPAAMRALDVVVHASTEPEPFGLVIIQAMACARALVISASGGACELVEPEIDALTHCPGDVVGLASTISRLATDVGLRAKLGTAARKHAARSFTRRRMADSMVPLYLQIASPRP